MPHWAGPKHLGTPGRLIIWCPFKLIILKLFSLWQGWRKFWERVPLLQIILTENLSRVKTRVYWNHISDSSNDVFAPLISWCLGQLPWCPTLVFVCITFLSEGQTNKLRNLQDKTLFQNQGSMDRKYFHFSLPFYELNIFHLLSKFSL